MTKKIVLAFVIAVATANIGFGQANPLRFVKDSLTPEKKIRKNEIGLNIAPALVIVSGGIPYAPNYSIFYKRVHHETKALRLGINVFTYRSFYYSNGINMSNNYDLIAHTDSTQIRRYSYRNPEDKIQVSLGYEWRREKRKIKKFFGIDMISGYYQTRETKYDIAFKLGSLIQQQLSYGTTPNFIPDDTQPESIVFSEISNLFYAGVHPFYGIKYSISERFSISAQTGFNLYYAFGKTSYNDYIKNNYRNYHSSYLSAETGNVINDISISYHF